MALHLLKSPTLHSEYADVDLDQDHVVFQGSPQEALAVYLSGNLTFRCKDPLTIKHIRLHLTGVRRKKGTNRCSLPLRTAWKRQASEEEFYKHTWEFHDSYRTTPQVLPAGEYKFPFNVVLEGSLPESAEGVKDASIAYMFTVEIGRKHGRDVKFQKPLRVVRVPENCAQDITLDEVWAEKIAYQIHVPNKIVAFGTSLDVNHAFVPAMRGLKIEYVESQLLEIRDFALNEADMDTGKNNTSSTTILSSDRYLLDNNPPDVAVKDTSGFQFARSLHLPKILGQCMQDIDTKGIRIKHKLKINVRMHNPDGHVSELRLAIPVSIYLSPYYRIWEGSSIAGLATPPPQGALSPSDEAPPAYGSHELDRLYSPESNTLLAM
ncbi:hypothetical protein ASPVEDRAFT_51907 [Aspergillus versicolor CBS 583.65]|uniref:Arrestin C-terminal-like domain-containing protein n=1 Tax=Aspergillus versicolor CBS 583.65 TaxID=1036611 RepID=A0A1L9PH31_ASPVE|nr:uncharacterized protein ASPVEDRAFT_51907 [Aspergillus versicolor CBS 583.65]OJJ00829.1 hypothetical protein ASPVEDRAFT_51907 [Aspergillus versicolor CBS 583.65]